MISDAESVLFDLDGTLTDPFEGITNSIVHALRYFGIEVADRRELACFIGPPLVESFRLRFGFSEAEACRAVAHYREYYAARGIFENTVYDGIPQLLDALKAAGRRLILATSKPEVFAERILAHFSLTQFDVVAGATLDSSRVEKADVIAYALEKAGIGAEHAVMVGDRKHDVLGARANEIPCVGVLYGYGSREELTAAGAAALARSPQALADVLLGRSGGAEE